MKKPLESLSNTERIQLFDSLSKRMSSIACLPQSEWKACAKKLAEDYTIEIAEEVLQQNLQFMKAKNQRLSLAVDPQQEDQSGLACVVGAIRLMEPGCNLAMDYLVSKLVKELEVDKNGVAVALATLTSEPLGKAPAFEVWKAIGNLLQPKPFELPEGAEPLPEEIQGMVLELHVPTSSEVRELTAENPEYPALQHLEQRRWSEVWDASGARDWVSMSKGGRPRKSEN